MRIESIVAREIQMRLKVRFETSFGTIHARRVILVEVLADGVNGRGEITASETPGFKYETTDSAWHILSAFIVPAVLGKTISNASEFPALTAPIRGPNGQPMTQSLAAT